ncbi:MAG TPA: tRNA (adenosine(37)-N6)-dimethylallyltransferase MiaA [Methylomirabilota bacterium]|nr:tRNA (adenosine(37)-N6)-dimethylallyltransferase MiaA [Methylomirabilota bacterium]
MDRHRLPLLVIVGPTGAGKTAAAVALARRVPLEVISADSRQVYRGMDTATGKPTAAERQAVPHHLIDVVDPSDRYHAARFRADAERLIGEIRGRGRLPAVVGGTGLYVRALLRGLDPAPPADPEFRRELAGLAAREGRAALHARLGAVEPALARRLHPNDEVRVVRALERLRAGSAVGDAQVRWRAAPAPWHLVHVGLALERRTLAARLAARTEAMVAAGLLDEVRGLLAQGYGPELSAMQGIGYRQFVQVAFGHLSEAEGLRLMQRDTLRYAKRQVTWFAREPGLDWIDVAAAAGAEGVAAAIEAKLKTEGLIE